MIVWWWWTITHSKVTPKTVRALEEAGLEGVADVARKYAAKYPCYQGYHRWRIGAWFCKLRRSERFT